MADRARREEGWTATRKRTLVIAILRGETSATEAARDHGLPVEQIEDWHARFLRGGEEALGDDVATSLASDRRRALHVRIASGAVALLWLALRLAYFNGYYVEDSPGYVTDALYAATGNYHARDHVNGLNVGTYLPVAVPLRLQGKTEAALSLWPLACSLLGLASLAAAAARLFGPPFGLLAGVLYATYPGDIFFSTVVMPDAIQAGWLSCSMSLIVFAAHAAAPRSAAWLVMAGAAMGVCHLVRANDAALLPAGVAAVALFWRLGKDAPAAGIVRHVLAYLGGWLAVIVLEGLAYQWAAGDFLHRLHVIARHYGTMASIRQWGLNIDPDTIPFSLFPPLLWSRSGEWGTLNHDQAYHGLLFSWAALALLAAALVLRSVRQQVPPHARAALAVAAVWFLWPVMFHQFGSQSITAYVPMHRLSRHLVVYAPGAIFAAVAGGFVLAQRVATFRSQAWRKAAGMAGVTLLVVHLFINWRAEALVHEAYHGIKRTYARIRAHLPPDTRTIVADPGDLSFFDFWLNPLGAEHVRLKVFATYSTCRELPAGVILTYSNPGWMGLSAPVIRETVTRLPCLLHPPPSWRLLYDGYPEKIFLVGPPTDAVR